MKRLELERLQARPFVGDLEVRALERAADAAEDEPTRYELSVSSEYKLRRWFGIEVLGHEPGDVNMARMVGAPLLLNHDTGDQIGVVEEAWLDEKRKKLRARVYFSRSQRAQEIEDDLVRKVRRQVSVGYEIDPKGVKLVTRGEKKGEPDEYRLTRWMPYEVSIVPVGADPNVGVGRSNPATDVVAVEIEDGDPVEEERGMKTKEQLDAEAAAAAAVTAGGAAAGAGGGGAAGAPDRTRDWQEMVKIARKHGMEDQLEAWAGRSLDEVRAEVLEKIGTKGEPAPASERAIKLDTKTAARYSYARAIMGALRQKAGEGRFDGLEREVSDELRRMAPAGYPDIGGVLVPLRLNEERALDTKTQGKGAEWINDVPGELIELLRNRSVIAGRGARVLSGLGAPIAFSKQKSGMTFYWVGENPAAGVSASDVALGLAILGPKNLMGQGQFSRQLLQLGNRDVEGFIRDEISIGHGLAIDRAAIHGLGAAGEPMGIYNAADVNAVAMGSAKPTFGKLIDMQTEVAKDNADLGSLGLVTTPGMAGALRQTLVASSAGSAMIWSGTMNGGDVAGYPAVATNQVSSLMSGSAVSGGTEHGIIFGNWADLIIGMFSALELIVDPYTDAGKAMVRITSFQMADILVRHGESFCKSTAATLT